jgi:R3H domain/RNA recognition motif. (a.k.a. RRM, RBD, or RNP domain)
MLNEPAGMDMSMQRSSLGRDGSLADVDDDLIPTAIVIKNIPFAVKKEQLVGLMTDMGLPLPYAFNYHFDNGIFRGLAFANFTSAEETQLVINALNHYELAGRKLRVEYKKMLPLQERERIEREKRIRRGQLEEQHRPLGPPGQLQNQASLSSLASGMVRNTPSPVNSRPEAHSFIPNLELEFARSSALAATVSIDFNDPMNLVLYTELVLFKRDFLRGDVMILPSTLTPAQRRVAHTIAHSLHLVHVSKGSGDDRAVHVYRTAEASASPPLGDMGNTNDHHRRALARSATTDLSDVRDAMSNTIVPRTSGFLGIAPDSPGGMLSSNLRNAKSFHDLRSWSPSPNQPSNPRFPDALMNGTTASNPNLTSTLPGLLSTNINRDRDDNPSLVNNFASLGLNGNFAPSSGSPLGSGNNRSPWDSHAGQSGQPPAPIGSNRTFSTAAGASTPTA